MTTPYEVALLRVVAQRLAGPGLPSAADAVRWMTAMQAQDRPGVLTSVALRTASRSRAEVVAALDDGSAVTSWPMRGTLHLVAAEDLRWMLSLTAPRMLATAAARRAGLGLDDAAFALAREHAIEALSGGRSLRREDLLALWSERGVAAPGPPGSHLLSHLAQTGVVCFGPMRGSDQLVVLVDEWVAHPRLLEPEEALGEWARRYLAGHGPATVRDLARWTGLPLGQARTGIAVARPHLERLEVDGVEHLLDPATVDRLDAHRDEARALLLLPGFDELLLGYADRTPTLPAEHADRIVPGGNGIFRPTVVSDGQVVGTWRRAGRGARTTIEATPFTAFSDQVTQTIPTAYQALPW